MSTNKKTKNQTFRNFATIFYSESTNKISLVNNINDLHVEAYLSPLHDADKFEDGTSKKSHFHLLLCFDGSRKLEFAQNIVSRLGGVGCEIVYSKIKYARYLCHLDHGKKAQYKPSDVVSFCGNYNKFLETPESKELILSQIYDFIDSTCIFFLSQLIRYARKNNKSWWYFLQQRSNTSLVIDYMRSLKLELQSEKIELEKKSLERL